MTNKAIDPIKMQTADQPAERKKVDPDEILATFTEAMNRIIVASKEADENLRSILEKLEQKRKNKA